MKVPKSLLESKDADDAFRDGPSLSIEEQGSNTRIFLK